MEGTRRTRKRTAKALADGGTRLLALASVLVLPSTLMSSLPASSAAFVVSPVERDFCNCKGQINAARHSTGYRRALPRSDVATDHARRRTVTDGIRMLWSGGRRTKGNEVTVNIERPSMNSRRISGSIVVNRPIEDVWLTLTDYDRLAEYVPNLTESKTKPSDDGRIRLWQEGAQKIVGFDFRASVEMFMEEQFGDSENRMSQRRLKFGLLESRMFSEFQGEWRMQFNSRSRKSVGGEYEYSTKLFYMVYIKPKGPVPVLALEWQISSEVPNNLSALKKAAESATPEYIEMRYREREAKLSGHDMVGLAGGEGRGGSMNEDNMAGERVAGEASRLGAEAYVAKAPGRGDSCGPEWQTDETLEAYMAQG